MVNFQGDFEDEANRDLVKNIEKALIGTFGYMGFILLVSGIMAVNQLDVFGIYCVSIAFLIHTALDYEDLFGEWNIRAIHLRRLSQTQVDKEDTTTFSAKNELLEFFTSLSLGGFYHYFTDASIQKFEVKNLHTHFHKNYYDFFDPDKRSKYSNAMEDYLAVEFSYLERGKTRDEHNTVGRGELKDYLVKKVDEAVKNILTKDWSDKSREWKEQTRHLVKDYLISYIDRPTKTYDPITSLREGKPLHIQSDANQYEHNPLLSEGFTVDIKYTDETLIKLMSKYFITTLFRAVKSGSARDTLDGGNYRLVFENEHIFNDAFLTKLKKTYKKVEGVFYEANGNHLKPEFDALRKDLQEEKKGLNLKFFTLAGMGVSMSKLKFFEQHISEEIDLGDEKAMKNMIAMAILIPTFFPRVHASITVGGGR
jgi:hypothetical protein